MRKSVTILGAMLVVAAALTAPAFPQSASATSGMAPDPDLVEDLVAANHILYAQGVVDGFGHVSARHDKDPARFLLARSMAPGLVMADDIMEFDLDGNALDRPGASSISNASSTAKSTRRIPRSRRSCTAIHRRSLPSARPACRCGRSII